MPYRNWNLVVAIIGAAAVAILLIVGVNVFRASQAGPAWRRKLIAAGLTLLAAIGATNPGCTPPATSEKKSQPELTMQAVSSSAIQQARGYVPTKELWQKFSDDWKFLHKLAREEKSTISQRNEADDRRRTVVFAIMELAERDELSEAEYELLRNELYFVMDQINLNPPCDSKVVFSASQPVDMVAKSFFRITDRLEMLEVAGISNIRPDVFKIIRDCLEEDRKILTDTSRPSIVSKEDRDKANSKALNAILKINEIENDLKLRIQFCYWYLQIPSSDKSYKQIAGRLRVLEAIGRGVVTPQVIGKALDSIERDIYDVRVADCSVDDVVRQEAIVLEAMRRVRSRLSQV